MTSGLVRVALYDVRAGQGCTVARLAGRGSWLPFVLPFAASPFFCLESRPLIIVPPPPRHPRPFPSPCPFPRSSLSASQSVATPPAVQCWLVLDFSFCSRYQPFSALCFSVLVCVIPVFELPSDASFSSSREASTDVFVVCVWT